MDFDEIVERRGTMSQKWDNVGSFFDVDPATCLPMWVADTDFRAPDCIRNALRDYVSEGVFGYWGDYRPYLDSIRWWQSERFGWEVERDWILTSYGVVNGMALMLEALTEPGDGVILFTPVYFAFHRIIKATGREVIEVPMVNEGGRYRMDLEGARAAAADGKARVVVLCSPHNPGGQVWSEAEIREVAAFAEEADLLLLSDEIHEDVLFDGRSHFATGRIDGIAERLIFASSASKTFNMGGLHTSHWIVPGEELRRRLAKSFAAHGMSTNAAGIVATTAAYSPDGAAWVDDLARYLAGNRDRLIDGVAEIPGISVMPMEATYLAWLDFSGTGMEAAEIQRRIQKDAGLALNVGTTFGKGGEGWYRLNIGTQRARIEEALERLSGAFSDLQ